MSYVIYNVKTTELLGGSENRKYYKTEGAAKATLTKAVRAGKISPLLTFAITDAKNFFNNIELSVEKVSLLSGKKVAVKVNTPMCCDPSTETYWSM